MAELTLSMLSFWTLHAFLLSADLKKNQKFFQGQLGLSVQVRMEVFWPDLGKLYLKMLYRYMYK